LTSEEALESRQKHGENVLTPPRRRSLWRLYLEKYEDPIIRILLVAAAISLGLAFITGEFVETIGIILAVLFATTVGFYFERDAARKFDVLTAMGEEQLVKVLRDGRVTQVQRRDVVVGDVVLVETGDEVPADGRLFESMEMQVDESSLTGETIASKTATPKNDSTAAYQEDLLLRSSMVMAGTGRMVVTAVGDETEIGHVAREAMELTQVKTPLNQQLNRLAALISKIGSAISTVAFLAFLIHDILTSPLWATNNYVGMLEVVLRYFMMAVTLIVMAVPEGLPMAVTLALALNMRRMLKSNNLVRKLQASETMGAVTVICTDKTGTLTQNRMTVQAVSEANYNKEERLFHLAIALNSTAELDGQQSIGNPTEAALLRWLDTQGTDYRLLRNEARITGRLPFSTEKKYMQTTAIVNGQEYTFVKGAPEVVLAQCQLTGDERLAIEQQLKEWQQRAMRTLAFSCNGHYQAIVAISDPIRSDVPKAVHDCQRAGIGVKIVTGDTEATALEIARQIGLIDEISNSSKQTITGPAFAALSDEEALELVATLKVMSRARPTDKQRLVSLLQQRGEVVAVTGDGTNDAPALNHAHVGLSLGSGTNVAKEASDITLLDDSFRSVVRAVEWGRSLYKNIQRFIFFQLVVNVTALLLVLGGAAIGTELPLTVTQILWINLIMDTFAAMALASLPPSHEVLNAPPRRADDFIISPGMKRGILWWGLLFFIFTFAYLYWLENNGTGQGMDTYELTKFFTVFVMLQWWNLFNARSLGSHHSAFHHFFWGKGFVLVLVLILLGQWLIVELGGEMFRTTPITPTDWLKIIVVTSPVMLAGELYRFWQRRAQA
jgi:Ca2+-transporting ATPase